MFNGHQQILRYSTQFCWILIHIHAISHEVDGHPLGFPRQTVEESPSQIVILSNHNGNIKTNSWTKSWFNGSTSWTSRLYVVSEVVIYWAAAVGGELPPLTSDIKIYQLLTTPNWNSWFSIGCFNFVFLIGGESKGMGLANWPNVWNDQLAQVGHPATLELWSRCWVLDCLCCRLLDTSQA